MKKNLTILFSFLLMLGCTTPADVINNPSNGSSVVPVADLSKTTNLITQKCAYCHSVNPNPASGYSSPPNGITFDSEAEMTRRARQINAQVSFGGMPRNPITITSEERAMILQWANSQ